MHEGSCTHAHGPAGRRLGRKNDQTTAVRLAFVDGAKGVLVNMTLAEQREQVEGEYLKLAIPASAFLCHSRGVASEIIGS